MFSKFAKIKSDDQDLMDIQQNVQNVLEPLFTVPIHDGIYLRDISLVAGSNRILHKLNRSYIGFIVCNTSPTNRGNLTTGSWQSFTPTITGNGSLTWSTTTLTSARYRVNGPTVEIQVTVTGTTGGVTNNFLIMQAPIPLKAGVASSAPTTPASTIDGTGFIGIVSPDYVNSRIIIYRDAVATNWGLGASRYFSFSTFYEAAAGYEFDDSIIEGVSTDPSVALNLICNSPMTASILVY